MSKITRVKKGDTTYGFKAIFVYYTNTPSVGVSDDNKFGSLRLEEKDKNYSIIRDNTEYSCLLAVKVLDTATTLYFFNVDNKIEVITNLDKYAVNLNNEIPVATNVGDITFTMPEGITFKDSLTMTDIEITINSIKSLSHIQDGKRYVEMVLDDKTFGNTRVKLVNNLTISTSALELDENLERLDVTIDGSDKTFKVKDLDSFDKISIPIG